MTRFKRYALRVLWALLPVVLLYASYVCLGGYPKHWDRIWPGMTVQEVVEMCGEPVEVSDKYGIVWRHAHLLGWHELSVDDTANGTVHHVYISSLLIPGIEAVDHLMIVRSSKLCD